jgi:endonuclease/exonuclease/phosphatase family metal-dependent hydrolase
MVQQFGDICAFNVYFLPETSNWARDLEYDPCLALNPSVAIAYAGRFQILIMGDLNGRTKSRMASVNDPPRVSMDDKDVSPRGRFLLKLCADYDLMIINGVDGFGPNSGAFTSFKGQRKPVIDYVICSKSLYSKITAFNVLPREHTFDHAALTVELEIDSSLLNMAARKYTKKRNAKTW